MQLFARSKSTLVKNAVLRLLNNHSVVTTAIQHGPRSEGRVAMVTVAMVVPFFERRLDVARGFTALTKEFASTGVALVFAEPCNIDEAAIGLRSDGEILWFRARSRHLSPLGGGFYQLGFRLTELLAPVDYPALAKLRF
jgi:hypothetical protein